jgi:hypothetical protein
MWTRAQHPPLRDQCARRPATVAKGTGVPVASEEGQDVRNFARRTRLTLAQHAAAAAGLAHWALCRSVPWVPAARGRISSQRSCRGCLHSHRIARDSCTHSCLTSLRRRGGTKQPGRASSSHASAVLPARICRAGTVVVWKLAELLCTNWERLVEEGSQDNELPTLRDLPARSSAVRQLCVRWCDTVGHAATASSPAAPHGCGQRHEQRCSVCTADTARRGALERR